MDLKVSAKHNKFIIIAQEKFISYINNKMSYNSFKNLSKEEQEKHFKQFEKERFEDIKTNENPIESTTLDLDFKVGIKPNSITKEDEELESIFKQFSVVKENIINQFRKHMLNVGIEKIRESLNPNEKRKTRFHVLDIKEEELEEVKRTFKKVLEYLQENIEKKEQRIEEQKQELEALKHIDKEEITEETTKKTRLLQSKIKSKSILQKSIKLKQRTLLDLRINEIHESIDSLIGCTETITQTSKVLRNYNGNSIPESYNMWEKILKEKQPLQEVGGYVFGWIAEEITVNQIKKDRNNKVESISMEKWNYFMHIKALIEIQCQEQEKVLNNQIKEYKQIQKKLKIKLDLLLTKSNLTEEDNELKTKLEEEIQNSSKKEEIIKKEIQSKIETKKQNVKDLFLLFGEEGYKEEIIQYIGKVDEKNQKRDEEISKYFFNNEKYIKGNQEKYVKTLSKGTSKNKNYLRLVREAKLKKDQNEKEIIKLGIEEIKEYNNKTIIKHQEEEKVQQQIKKPKGLKIIKKGNLEEEIKKPKGIKIIKKGNQEEKMEILFEDLPKSVKFDIINKGYKKTSKRIQNQKKLLDKYLKKARVATIDISETNKETKEIINLYECKSLNRTKENPNITLPVNIEDKYKSELEQKGTRKYNETLVSKEIIEEYLNKEGNEGFFDKQIQKQNNIAEQMQIDNEKVLFHISLYNQEEKTEEVFLIPFTAYNEMLKSKEFKSEFSLIIQKNNSKIRMKIKYNFFKRYMSKYLKRNKLKEEVNKNNIS